MRKLMLMRHAKADDQYKGHDSQRPLVETGRDVHHRVSTALKELKLDVDAIFFSPYLRAKQSAEILHEVFPHAELIQESALGAQFNSNAVLDPINKSDYKTVVLVGHEPSLALLGAELMEHYKAFKLEKSGVLALEFKDEIKLGEGEYKFYLSPKDLS